MSENQNSVLDYFVQIIHLLITVIRFIVAIVEAIYTALTRKAKDVSKEVVLITGAGHGLGREFALQFSDLGATVVCWDINGDGNSETVELIKSRSGKAFGYTVDVTKREKIFETRDRVFNDAGDVTILVNNAGILYQHSLIQHSEAEIRRSFEVNTIAQIWMLQAFLPKMIENDRGHVVAVSSMGALYGIKNFVPYCATKSAIRGIMESMLQELMSSSKGKSNVKFTTAYPFFVNTGLYENLTFGLSLLSVLNARDTVSAIIDAQRKEKTEITVPSYFLYLYKFGQLFPTSCTNVIRDAMKIEIESDVK